MNRKALLGIGCGLWLIGIAIGTTATWKVKAAHMEMFVMELEHEEEKAELEEYRTLEARKWWEEELARQRYEIR